MFLKFLICFLVFDGVVAVLLWLLIAHDTKAADRKIEEALKARDPAIDGS